MSFDKLFASKPVNKQTAMANSGGYTYAPKIKEGARTSQICPPILPMSPRVPEDLTGKKFGRLTVVGYGGRHKNKHVTQWVVRCVCGNFEYRRSKSINNPSNFGDRCQECDAILHLKRQDYINRFGAKKGLKMLDEEIRKEDLHRTENK